MKLWILVFLFNGNPVASGPHELEVCLLMARDLPNPQGAHCWNPGIDGGRNEAQAADVGRHLLPLAGARL